MSFPTDPSYTAQALRTESPITPALHTRLQQQARLVHAVLGLQTEAGELADPVKKHIYYGRPLDPVNLREEIGDCLWYLAIACDALGTTLEAEQARNLAKLRTRYPHVFTAAAAQVRDLDRERQVLEGADVETAPVAEPAPCPECELSEEMQDAVPPTWAPLVWDLRRRLREAQQELGRELLDADLRGRELERLQAFVGTVREAVNLRSDVGLVPVLNRVMEALAELDANSSAILTSSAVKDSLTTQAEGGQ